MTTHIMKLNPEPFEKIKLGIKTIEMRLYDEKRQKIAKGDYIEFLNNLDEEEKLLVRVKELHRFNNFEELYKTFDKRKLGYKEEEIAHYRDMEQYYSKEEIENYGVVGIEVIKIDS